MNPIQTSIVNLSVFLLWFDSIWSERGNPTGFRGLLERTCVRYIYLQRSFFSSNFLFYRIFLFSIFFFVYWFFFLFWFFAVRCWSYSVFLFCVLFFFYFLRSALTFYVLAAIEETGDTAVNNNNNNQKKKKKNKYNLDKMFLKFSLI